MPIQLNAEGERHTLGDSEVIFKSTEGWMSAQFTLGPRRNGAAPHYHQKLIESFYVIEGALWLQVGDREVTAGPGSYALVPPGTLHAFANRSDWPVKFLLQASDTEHAAFLRQLYDMVRSAPSWPPQDPAAMIALGLRYDTYFR